MSKVFDGEKGEEKRKKGRFIKKNIFADLDHAKSSYGNTSRMQIARETSFTDR